MIQILNMGFKCSPSTLVVPALAETNYFVHFTMRYPVIEEMQEYHCNSCNASFKKEFHLKEHFTYYHDGKNDKPSHTTSSLKGQ